MKVIDTHQHLWNLEQFPYSWCEPYPTLKRTFLMEDYLAAIHDSGIVASVHVEADVDEPFMLDETRHICGLAEQENPLCGVVACGRPESPGFRAYLDQIAALRRVKGIRRVLHTQPDGLSQTPLFVDNIRSLADYGLSFDIVMQEKQLPQAINLVCQCPEVSFILDHCGNPNVKSGQLDPWREHIASMAALPNVVCKVSGIVTSADPERWTVDDLRPYVDHVIASFGWDRVLFGSDWPVCHLGNASLRRWLDTALELTAAGGLANQRKLFHDNALRVYRLSL